MGWWRGKIKDNFKVFSLDGKIVVLETESEILKRERRYGKCAQFWFENYWISGVCKTIRYKGLEACYKLSTEVWVRDQCWKWRFGSHPLGWISETLRVNNVSEGSKVEKLKINNTTWFILLGSIILQVR